MLTKYLAAAMHHAHYEFIEDDRLYAGTIDGLLGVIGTGDTLEACRDDLEDALEEWILAGVALGHEIPEMDGLRIEIRQAV